MIYKEASWYKHCVACGGRYHPVYLMISGRYCQEVSDHHCKPRSLAKRRYSELKYDRDNREHTEDLTIDEAFEISEIMSDGMDG